MKFSFYIAKRYLFSKSKNNAINIITIIAGIGVFAGALALFIVLSGFSGLKEFSVQFTNEIDPDLKVLPSKGKTITFNKDISDQLEDDDQIENYSKIIEERVLLSINKRSTPAEIKGVDFNYNKVTDIRKSLVAGNWFEQGNNQVIIGDKIAQKLSTGISGFDEVLQLSVPKPGKGVISDPREAFKNKNTQVIGIYGINEDLNDRYIFTPFSLAKELLNLSDDEISALEVKLKPKTKEKEAIAALQTIFGEEKVVIKNRMQLNDELYKMLNTENLAVYLIFTLVLIIALFNVGGAIVMAILDKRDNIKTLYNLGARTINIKHIFFLQGALLTFIGGVIGLIAGAGVVFLQKKLGFVMITQTLSYPVSFEIENLIIVFLTIMTLGFVASYIGATRVTKVLN